MLPETLQSTVVAAPEPALALLERKRRPLAWAALVGALAGATAAQLLPPRYRATAHLVVVPTDDPTGGSPTSGVEQATATLPIVVTVLHSARLAEAVVARLGLSAAWHMSAPAAALRLRAILDVATDRKSNLVTVAAEDRVPTRARDLVAAVTDEATTLGNALWSARNRTQRARLEADRAEVQRRLDGAEVAMRAFCQRAHVVDLPTQVKASVEQAAALERLHVDKAIAVRLSRGFGDDDAIEVRRATRERDAVARALVGLRTASAAPGPLLALDDLPAIRGRARAARAHHRRAGSARPALGHAHRAAGRGRGATGRRRRAHRSRGRADAARRPVAAALRRRRRPSGRARHRRGAAPVGAPPPHRLRGAVMCGVVAIARPGGLWDDERDATLVRMRDALAHRGPDDATAAVVDDWVALGHRRLSIIDLRRLGASRSTTSDGTVACIFNGEIYNFVQLRARAVRARPPLRHPRRQ